MAPGTSSRDWCTILGCRMFAGRMLRLLARVRGRVVGSLALRGTVGSGSEPCDADPAHVRPILLLLVLLLTASGLVLGLVGAWLLPSRLSVLFLVSSLGIDCVDGLVARRWHVVTDSGRLA